MNKAIKLIAFVGLAYLAARMLKARPDPLSQFGPSAGGYGDTLPTPLLQPMTENILMPPAGSLDQRINAGSMIH